MSDSQQKELGYVELEWTCPVCKTRNPGTVKTCQGCGAAQPKDVQFEAPAAAQLTTDQAKIDAAKAGPDIHCAFCGARNPAGAKACKQCGADLTQGKAREAGGVVGAFDPNAPKEVACPSCGQMNPAGAATCSRCGAPLSKPSPRPSAQPAAPPAPRSVPATSGFGGMNLVLIAIGAIFALAICGFLFWGFRTNTTTATATGAHWERSIDIVAPVPVRSSAWRDQLPSGAANVSCQPQFRYNSSQPVAGAQEVCGTPYTIDTGTGMGKVVQDCQYRVYDDMCTYTTMQLAVVNTVVDKGVGFSPKWPATTLTGQQKLGNRNERYYCDLKTDRGTFSFPMQTFNDYQRCNAGSVWKVEVNSFGDVVSAQLAK